MRVVQRQPERTQRTKKRGDDVYARDKHIPPSAWPLDRCGVEDGLLALAENKRGIKKKKKNSSEANHRGDSVVNVPVVLFSLL